MKELLLFLFLFVFFATGFSQSRIIQSLKDGDKVKRGYYLYPSTLRMLNFQDDQEFNKMIRDVRKVSFLNMDVSSFGDKDARETIRKLEKEEGFETYLELTESDSELLVLGRENPDELIGVSSQGENCYIIDLQGKIDLLQLPKIYENFTNRDTSRMDGLSMLFDMVSEDADRDRRREERRRKREEERKREEARKDSIEQSKAILPEDSLETNPQ